MDFITIKPLSVNACWQGKRYKTDSYKKYEHDVMFLMPRFSLPSAPYRVELEFGVFNPAFDLDNPVKPILDIFQKKFGFNDKLIYELIVKKKIIPKGQKEYIGFSFSTFSSQ